MFDFETLEVNLKGCISTEPIDIKYNNGEKIKSVKSVHRAACKLFYVVYNLNMIFCTRNQF